MLLIILCLLLFWGMRSLAVLLCVGDMCENMDGGYDGSDYTYVYSVTYPATGDANKIHELDIRYTYLYLRDFKSLMQVKVSASNGDDYVLTCNVSLFGKKTWNFYKFGYNNETDVYLDSEGKLINDGYSEDELTNINKLLTEYYDDIMCDYQKISEVMERR